MTHCCSAPPAFLTRQVSEIQQNVPGREKSECGKTRLKLFGAPGLAPWALMAKMESIVRHWMADCRLRVCRFEPIFKKTHRNNFAPVGRLRSDAQPTITGRGRPVRHPDRSEGSRAVRGVHARFSALRRRIRSELLCPRNGPRMRPSDGAPSLDLPRRLRSGLRLTGMTEPNSPVVSPSLECQELEVRERSS